uniref:Uncharacterized protein n=1 Tax=Oryza glumipatula TaxID=40148 RepID=A0A0D9ZZU5_9ORYZ
MPSVDGGDALFCGGVEPPTLTAVSDLAATTDDATVSDAAELALLDAPVPTTFPAGASDAVAAFARFIGSLGKKIFQVEDSFAEGYDKLRLSAYDALGAWRKSVDGVVGGLTASVDATKKQAANGAGAAARLRAWRRQVGCSGEDDVRLEQNSRLTLLVAEWRRRCWRWAVVLAPAGEAVVLAPSGGAARW